MSCKKSVETNGLIEHEISAANRMEIFRFVLSADFRGEMRVVEDEKQGVDIPFDGEQRIIQVPVSGEVVVKSFRPFQKAHKELAVFTDGRAVADPYAVVGDLPKDTTFFFNCGLKRGGKYPTPALVYYIGTKKELDDHQ